MATAEAAHRMSHLNWPAALADAVAVGEYLRQRFNIQRVGIVGFCLGGALSLLAAQHAPDVFGAASTYYGIPNAQHCGVQGLFDPSRVLIPTEGHFGELDRIPGFSDVAAAELLEVKAGSQPKIYIHEQRDHAFMNFAPWWEAWKAENGRPPFDPGIAEAAWATTTAFFQRHLVGEVDSRLSGVMNLLTRAALVLCLRASLARGSVPQGALLPHLAPSLHDKVTTSLPHRPAIASIRAAPKRNLVLVEYVDDGLEILRFDAAHHLILEVNVIQESEIPSVSAQEEARVALELLSSFLIWLEADVMQDGTAQMRLLDPSVRAFGEVGAHAVVKGNLALAQTGVSYGLPYPILLNTDKNCTVLDFDVYGSDGKKTGRGTDILYFDMKTRRVLKIDTLRHEIEQPDWLKRHYAPDSGSCEAVKSS
eukprot:gnl/MRDRNA2_/MRDRNA2_33391_c0_seq1.p1 gnl/MRDRNA2_/MRDRNA2_33391_c0~~gnl/MRDRNA2_/MRDRNA2_33391_c0_seq1.p1  ORF type:complete len:422 (-),score=82.35 gnl/MRDRNA2_/MRDRNA2_33391_c0_seq1:30-1295(-)